MAYVKCTCGKSDGNDDRVVSREIEDVSYNGADLTLREIRKCDICNKQYHVLVHYVVKWEELDPYHN